MNAEAHKIHTGGCACGAIRFEVHGRRMVVADCHCRICQRVAGAPVVTWASIRAERLRLLRGEPRWWRSSVAAERGFCADCGGSLFFRAVGGGPTLDVAVCAFDAPEELRPAFQIWTSSRQPWVHLDPALPSYEASGPDWTPTPPRPRTPAEPASLRYQEGGPLDLVQLAELFRAVGFQRRTDPAQLGAMVDGARWVLTAWHERELIGFARAISDGVSNAYVSAVAVRPDWQRRGVGRALMERLLAGREGVKFVLRTSPEGEPLYRSLGFVDADRILVRPRVEPEPPR